MAVKARTLEPSYLGSDPSPATHWPWKLQQAALTFWASITLSEKWRWYQHLPCRGALRISWVNKHKGLQTPSTGIRLWKYLLLSPGLWKRHKRKYNNRFFQSIKHLPAFQKTLICKIPFLGLDLSPFADFIQKNNDLLWSRKPWGNHFERKLRRKFPRNLLGEKNSILIVLKASQPWIRALHSESGQQLGHVLFRDLKLVPRLLTWWKWIQPSTLVLCTT